MTLEEDFDFFPDGMGVGWERVWWILEGRREGMGLRWQDGQSGEVREGRKRRIGR